MRATLPWCRGRSPVRHLGVHLIRPRLVERALQCFRPREQDVVFLMNVSVQIDFELMQAIKHDPIGIAGVVRWQEALRQAAKLFQRDTGFVVFMLHHANRVRHRAEREPWPRRCGFQAADGGKENPFFFEHVRLQFRSQLCEHDSHFLGLRMPLPMGISDPVDAKNLINIWNLQQ